MKSSLLLVLTKKISVLFIFFSTLKFKNNRGNDVNNIISPPEIQYILQLTFNRFNRKINIELKIIPNPILTKSGSAVASLGMIYGDPRSNFIKIVYDDRREK